MTTETFDDADAVIARLGNELDKAREVLFEMDKIVDGHVADVGRQERVIVGLNKQLTEQFELSTKYVGISERLRALNAEMLAIAKRWRALDDCAWDIYRHAAEKTELLKATDAAIAKAEGQS